MWSIDWGVFLREQERQVRSRCCYSRCTLLPLLCKSLALSPLWDQRGFCIVRRSWACALTKLLPAALHRDEHFSTKHRVSWKLGKQRTTRRLREWELMQEQSPKEVWHADLSWLSSIHEPFQPHQHSARPGAWGQRPCSIGHTHYG
jgi:hypothetical protein